MSFRNRCTSHDLDFQNNLVCLLFTTGVDEKQCIISYYFFYFELILIAKFLFMQFYIIYTTSVILLEFIIRRQLRLPHSS